MQFTLTSKELLVILNALEVQELYGYGYDDETNPIQVGEDEIESLIQSLTDKLYVAFNNETDVVLEKHLYNAISLWENHDKSITVLKKHDEEIKINKFIFIKENEVMTLVKIDNEYALNYETNKEAIQSVIKEAFLDKSNEYTKCEYNISLSGETFDELTTSFFDGNNAEMNKQFDKIQINHEDGYRMLSKITEDELCTYAIIEDINSEIYWNIKVFANSEEQYIFKHVVEMDEVILIKGIDNKIVDSICII